MSCTKLVTEYEEIYRIRYLRKFINSLKLLGTKNHSNRSNIKCVLPNQAELARSELLTPVSGANTRFLEQSQLYGAELFVSGPNDFIFGLHNLYSTP